MLRTASFAAVLLFASCTISADPCNSTAPRGPDNPCDTLLPATVQNALNVFQQYGQVLGEQGVAIDKKVKEARRKFLQTSPPSPAYLKAWTELSNALLMKDLWYLNIDSQVVLPIPYPNYLDGGIPKGALERFDNWTSRVKRGAGREVAGMFRAGGTETLDQALRESEPWYENYRLLRNWLEFCADHRNITDDPERYAKYVVAMSQPWTPSSRSRLTSAEQTEEYYAAMADLFGRDALLKASRNLMAAPKNADGVLQPGIGLNGRRYFQPYLALMAFLSQGSAHNYFLAEMGRGNLRAANENYNRFRTAYGEKAVLAVLDDVRNAPKTEDGSVNRRLDISTSEPYPVFQWMLCQQDAQGCLRVAIAFHEKTASAAAIEAAYRDLTLRYGETAVNSTFNRAINLRKSTSVDDRNLAGALDRAADPDRYYRVVVNTLNDQRTPATPASNQEVASTPPAPVRRGKKSLGVAQNARLSGAPSAEGGSGTGSAVAAGRISAAGSPESAASVRNLPSNDSASSSPSRVATPGNVADSAQSDGALQIPRGTQILVHTSEAIRASETKSGQRFKAVLDQPVRSGRLVILPVGAEVYLTAREQPSAYSNIVHLMLRVDSVIGSDGKEIAVTSNEIDQPASSRAAVARLPSQIGINRGGIRIGGGRTTVSTPQDATLPAHMRLVFYLNGTANQ